MEAWSSSERMVSILDSREVMVPDRREVQLRDGWGACGFWTPGCMAVVVVVVVIVVVEDEREWEEGAVVGGGEVVGDGTSS
jgi:hypothetical protein